MAGQALSWNLRADMMNGISKNPTGVWAFMENLSLDHNPSNHQLLPNYSNNCLAGDFYDSVDVNSRCWEDLNEPYTIIGITKKLFKDANGKTVPLGFINLHPATNRSVIVRWASPVTGSINISGRISHQTPGGCGDGISYSIDQESSILMTGKLVVGNGVAFDKQNIAITKGQSLYFIIFPDSNRYCDSTGMDILITSQQ